LIELIKISKKANKYTDLSKLWQHVQQTQNCHNLTPPTKMTLISTNSITEINSETTLISSHISGFDAIFMF